MFKRTDMQARNPARASRSQGMWVYRMVQDLDQARPVYPEVPAGWPNRATRRAVKQGKDSRLSAPWRAVLNSTAGLGTDGLTRGEQLRSFIKGM